jgi:hypothetical protein
MRMQAEASDGKGGQQCGTRAGAGGERGPARRLASGDGLAQIGRGLAQRGAGHGAAGGAACTGERCTVECPSGLAAAARGRQWE